MIKFREQTSDWDRGEEGMETGAEKMSEGSPKVQTSNHKVNKSWGCGDVMYSMVTIAKNTILYMKKLFRE